MIFSTQVSLFLTKILTTHLEQELRALNFDERQCVPFFNLVLQNICVSR